MKTKKKTKKHFTSILNVGTVMYLRDKVPVYNFEFCSQIWFHT